MLGGLGNGNQLINSMNKALAAAGQGPIHSLYELLWSAVWAFYAFVAQLPAAANC